MAGPYCAWLLANLGIEVIKVESCNRPDPIRIMARGVYPNGDPGEHSWNRSGMVNVRNLGKYGITLDIATDQGREIFLRLVKISRAVVENFQVGVLEKLCIPYETLIEVNPEIVLVSLSSQGLTGPEKGYRSFGNTLEQTGGLFSVTGYAANEPPYISTLVFPDVLGGVMGAGLLLAALRYSQKMKKSVHVDLSQREITVNVIGEAVMDYNMNKRLWEPINNHDRFVAPHSCYRCRGEDEWITISICTDEQWKRLCNIMGKTELAGEAKFSDTISRFQNQAEIDPIIAAWTATQNKYDLQNRLQEAGIAAGAVLNARDICKDPHINQRGFFDLVTHPEAGTHLYPGRPAKLSGMPEHNPMPAPCLGEHNEYIYGNLLGLSKKEIEELEKTGIIGKLPTEDALKFG